MEVAHAGNGSKPARCKPQELHRLRRARVFRPTAPCVTSRSNDFSRSAPCDHQLCTVTSSREIARPWERLKTGALRTSRATSSSARRVPPASLREALRAWSSPYRVRGPTAPGLFVHPKTSSLPPHSSTGQWRWLSKGRSRSPCQRMAGLYRPGC